MAKYWASCPRGLEFALIAELKSLDHIDIICESMIFGGVIFSTVSAPMELMKLRSADNIYAFVGRFQDLPSDKAAALRYFNELVGTFDWKPPLDLFWEWKYEKIDISERSERNQPRSFRVTCDRACVEMKKHGFTSMEAAAALGEGIHERYGWPADMLFYDLEVLAWIRDSEILLVIALLYRELPKFNANAETVNKSEVQSEKGNPNECMEKIIERPSRTSRVDSQLYAHRKYRKSLVETSLKPSVANALLQLGFILPGNVVLDPMCGCGTIPFEAVDWLGNRIFSMAGDVSSKAVNTTSDNLKACEGALKLDVLQWDASNLPLRTGCVDRVICDMPFGIRCGTSRSREVVCPKVLKEVARILQPRTGIAVLLGQSKAAKHEIETKQKPFLQLLQNIPIQMQGLRIEILVLQRSAEPYHTPCYDAKSKLRCNS